MCRPTGESRGRESGSDIERLGSWSAVVGYVSVEDHAVTSEMGDEVAEYIFATGICGSLNIDQ